MAPDERGGPEPGSLTQKNPFKSPREEGPAPRPGRGHQVFPRVAFAELWPELAELLIGEAVRVGEVDKTGPLLHQAARIQRDKPRDEAGAARSLRMVMESAPGDIETLRELTAWTSGVIPAILGG